MTAKLPPHVDPDVAKYMEVFHPHATRRMAEIHAEQLRFVHYSSAAVGLEILNKKMVWMRQASCMNDYMEIEHGLNCVDKGFKGDHGIRLKTFLDTRFKGISTEIEQMFEASKDKLRFDTYITCLSEHAGKGHEQEDQYGRLSMWRAYGRGTGVALVINQSAFWATTTQLGIFSTPVAYLSDVDFAEEMGIVATTLEANADFLDQIGREQVRNSVVNAFATAAVSTKHPGFKEEREWRVVQMPTFPFTCPFDKPTKVIHEVPQEILLIDLTGQPPRGMVGLAIPAILDRVIIGPTDFPMPQYRAFGKALAGAGVSDAYARIKISGIPLRASSA